MTTIHPSTHLSFTYPLNVHPSIHPSFHPLIHQFSHTHPICLLYPHTSSSAHHSHINKKANNNSLNHPSTHLYIPSTPFTHPSIDPSTHQPTQKTTHPLTNPPIHQPTFSPTHPLTNPPTHLSTHLPTHLATHPPTNPPTYQPTYQPTYPSTNHSTTRATPRTTYVKCVAGEPTRWRRSRWIWCPTTRPASVATAATSFSSGEGGVFCVWGLFSFGGCLVLGGVLCLSLEGYIVYGIVWVFFVYGFSLLCCLWGFVLFVGVVLFGGLCFLWSFLCLR